MTGVLTYGDCRFLQFLEGQKLQVEQIFSMIKKDTRHHCINVVRRGFIPERQFSDWHMKYAGVNDINYTHGLVRNQISNTQTDEPRVTEQAVVTISMLMAFKFSCSEQLHI